MCHFFFLTVILLPGKDRDSNLSSSSELISSSAKAVDELVTGLSKEGTLMPSPQLPCLQSAMAARDELHSALQSLSSSWNQQGAGESRSSAASDKSTEDEILTKESATTHSAVRNRVASKTVFSLPRGVLPKGSSHWVWCAFIQCVFLYDALTSCTIYCKNDLLILRKVGSNEWIVQQTLH